MRLVLWDVDGTLVNSSGAIGKARSISMQQVYGVEGRPPGYPVGGFGGGMTDPQLTLALMALFGWAEADALARMDEWGLAYVAALEAAKHTLKADLQVIAGVEAVLARLNEEAGVLQSLLTGNMVGAARLKMEATGLDQHLDLDLGGFGSDNRDRNCLVPVALGKAQRLKHATLRAEDVVVIGDSPRDIACARAGGARAVAVATGPHTPEELAEHKPDAIIEDHSDIERSIARILGL